MPARFEVTGHAADRLMQLAQHRPVGRVARCRAAFDSLRGVAVDKPVHAREKTPHALDALVLPVEIPVGRRRKQREHAGGVRAVGLDEVLRTHHVAEVLGHLVAVADDHALREKPADRLVPVDQPEVPHHHREEAAVDQVQHRVLHASDVLVDREPRSRFFGTVGRIRIPRVDVAVEVPARVHERVHRVGFPLGLASASRAGSLRVLRQALQRRFARAGEFDA